MTQQFHQLLLSELRMVAYRPGNPVDLTDELLCEAVTLNENLRSLGFTLRPDDLVRLAVSPSLEGLYDRVRELVPDVNAEPMYPGFPQQVMDMDEAEFRLHQMIHYFSTYGLEMLLGCQVDRGWLPEYSGPARTVRDTKLLEDRVVDLVPEQEAPVRALKAILNRRERLTCPEEDLVRQCVPQCGAEELLDLKVRFKENLEFVFGALMEYPDTETALQALRAACSHTGDVFRCAKNYLGRSSWHLATGKKKRLVRLLESYPAADLRQNLMQSLQVRERNLNILRHLDYNRFSRSAEHREAVRALRSGELPSWFAAGERLLLEKSPEALAYFAQRPGYMLRMINRLLTLGYPRESIEEAMLPAADKISTHLILKVLRTLLRRRDDEANRYAREKKEILDRYTREEASRPPTWADFCKELEWEISWRRRQIMKPVILRESVPSYREADWLQECRSAEEKELQRWKRVLHRIADWPQISGEVWLHADANASLDDDIYVLYYLDHPEALEETLGPIEDEMASLEAEIYEAEKEGDREYRELEARSLEEYAAELEAEDAWARQKRENRETDFAERLERHREAMETLPARRAAALAALEESHEAKLWSMRNDPRAAEVLKALLKQHFRQAETPLKGKKVFFDLDRFDLVHSVLETEDRSKDGGYIRSGICWKIPEEARYVRFFVYWNDRRRVDVDLHAGGITADGEALHIGWNAACKNHGVVYSGDITHSDAAEYIDIDLSAPVSEIYANICLFSGRCFFRDVETCYVGLMAVNRIGQAVRHYNPANCFFTHALTQKTGDLYYGYIDVRNRFVRFIGQPNGDREWDGRPDIGNPESEFSLEDYLDCVAEGQSVRRVQNRNEADVVLCMEKGADKNAVSLADSNFFLEC